MGFHITLLLLFLSFFGFFIVIFMFDENEKLFETIAVPEISLLGWEFLFLEAFSGLYLHVTIFRII